MRSDPSILPDVVPLRADLGLNGQMGINLWGDNYLWDDKSVDMVKRLGFERYPGPVPITGSQIYIYNPAANVKVLGTRLYSLNIYAGYGVVNRVILTFVNLSDLHAEMDAEYHAAKSSFSQTQFEVDVAKKYDSQSHSDFKTIEDVMNRRLKATRTDYEAGKDPKLIEWVWESNTMTLERQDRSVTFTIVPVLGSANAGKIDMETLLRNVSRLANGDVTISNVPPICQGPRSFCLPAAWEKCLLYLGSSINIYKLIEKGGTEERGTSFSKMTSVMSVELGKQGMNVKLLNETAPKISAVRPYIDQGLPVIWALEASSLADWVERTPRRGPMGLPKSPALVSKMNPAHPMGHAMTVIGYNILLKEIALSDTTELGSSLPVIWITEEDAVKSSAGEPLIVLSPKVGSSSSGEDGSPPPGRHYY